MSIEHVPLDRNPQLARMVDLDPSVSGSWRSDELRQILRYRLSVPLYPPGFPVVGDGKGGGAAGEVDDAGVGLADATLGQLLRHPAPPAELLRQVKDFAESSRRDPESPLPPEISTLLYYVSLAAGLVRGGG